MDASSLVSLLAPEQHGRSGLEPAWKQLLAGRERPETIYQSPEWLGHLQTRRDAEGLRVAVVEGADGDLQGVAPLRLGQHTLKFDVAARALAATSFQTAYLLGSEPLLPDDVGLHDALFEALWRQLPECECIYMDSVATDGFLWRYLHEYASLETQSLLYVPDGSRQHHLIELPESFELYLRKFSAKTRNTLRRKERRLAREGELRVQRVEDAADVPAFVDAAVRVSRRSWQHAVLGPRIGLEDVERLQDLARRGLLRSYLLSCGAQPCAFVLGYQYDGAFQYVEVAFDQRYGERKLSPSTVLLYRVIEDLIDYRPATRFNFGVGEADYKQFFGNSSYRDASVLLLRSTLRNRLLKLSHHSFRSSVTGAKHVLSRLRRT